MTARVLTEAERAILLGTILSNPKASVRDIEALVSAQGVKVSRWIIPNYQKRAKELVHGLAYKQADSDEVITSPVVQSGLVDAAVRINELNEIYYRLKDEMNSGGLWQERVRVNGDGDTITEYTFNFGLVKEMRGCLGDIAKEVGGRSTHAIIEHRNADTGTVDIHAMILNVQQTVEARNNQAISAPPKELLAPGSEKVSDTVLDLPEEMGFIESVESENSIKPESGTEIISDEE